MGKDEIRNMIDNILSNKEADALDNFNLAVAEKLTDSLDDRKQEIAAGLGQTDEEKKPIHMDPLVGSVMSIVDKLAGGTKEKDSEKPAAQGKTVQPVASQQFPITSTK